jgi:hypothetical protein
LVAYEKDSSFNIIDVMLISSIQMGPPEAPSDTPGSGQPAST